MKYLSLFYTQMVTRQRVQLLFLADIKEYQTDQSEFELTGYLLNTLPRELFEVCQSILIDCPEQCFWGYPLTIRNTPRAVLLGWTSLAVGALVAFNISKEYTLNQLKTYTVDNSVTSSRGKEDTKDTYDKDGNKILRRSVDRRL
ncbi:hypothetical protein BDB01DRAFT_831230 [Pilobolus umbonatus]|nr:hypothetical protein BDB01DRAFT_831230 [Pilobolus umbonatus]